MLLQRKFARPTEPLIFLCRRLSSICLDQTSLLSSSVTFRRSALAYLSCSNCCSPYLRLSFSSARSFYFSRYWATRCSAY